MTVSVRIPTILRTYTQDQSQVDADGATLADVLDVTRRTGGAVEDVSEDEIRDGITLLARTEGIFAETAGGVTVATLKKLLANGQLDPDAETVVFNTGDGLKTLDAISDRVGPTATIDATYDAFVQAGIA